MRSEKPQSMDYNLNYKINLKKMDSVSKHANNKLLQGWLLINKQLLGGPCTRSHTESHIWFRTWSHTCPHT